MTKSNQGSTFNSRFVFLSTWKPNEPSWFLWVGCSPSRRDINRFRALNMAGWFRYSPLGVPERLVEEVIEVPRMIDHSSVHFATKGSRCASCMRGSWSGVGLVRVNRLYWWYWRRERFRFRSNSSSSSVRVQSGRLLKYVLRMAWRLSW